MDGEYEYAVWVSYAEIYNEKAFDLLETSEQPDAHENNAPAPAPTNERPASPMKRSNTFTRLPVAGPSTIPRSNTFASLLPNRGSVRFSASTNLATIARLSSIPQPTTLSRKALALRTDPVAGAKYIHGLREVRVRSSAEARKVVRLGQINRRVFGTLMNKESSRSHAVFTVKVVKVRKGAVGEVRVARVWSSERPLIEPCARRRPLVLQFPDSPSSISQVPRDTRIPGILERG